MLRLRLPLRRALLGAALWALGAGRAAASGPPQVIIQLKWYDQFQFAGYYAAEQAGLYRAAGLDVTLRPGGRGLDPVREVLSGRAQFGIGDSDLLLARAKGAPVVVLAAVFQHSPYIILSRADARLARPSDLVGKRIMALEDQGAAQIRAMLLREGIDPGGVRLVRHSWDLQDLVQGRVDGMTAYLTVEPYQLQKLGVTPAVLRPSDYGIDFYGDCLFTTEAELRDHPEEVEAVRKATLAGWSQAMRDPGSVIPWILARPDVEARGIGADNLAYEAKAMQPLVLADVVPVGHMNAARWGAVLDTYKRLGLVPDRMTLDGFLYNPSPESGLGARALRWALLALLAVVGLLAALAAWAAALRRAVRQRTRQLQEDRAELQLAKHSVDQARDYISWVDREGRYLYANRAVLDLYGLSLASLQARHIWEQVPGLDRAAWDRMWEEVAARGMRRAEMALATHDGRPVPVEMLSTLVDSGATRVCCNISRDLSEHRRGEAERLAHDRKLSLILEGAGVAYWEWHLPTGALIMDLTLDRLLGYAPGELPRRIGTWFDHLNPDDRDRIFSVLQPFLDGAEGTYDAEFRLSRKDGSWAWFNAKGQVTERGPGGKAVRIQGVLQDIDARKRTEEGLRQAQRLESLGLLAGGIAHDFNNLLTAVLGNLSLARLGLAAGSPPARNLEKAEEAVQQAAALTHQLLAYSGKGRLMVGPIDLNALVLQMRDLLEIGLGKDTRLETRLAPERPFLEGDATQVQQVLLNLLTNAAEAIGPKAGLIRVGTRVAHLAAPTPLRFPPQAPLQPGEYAVLEVQDTGCGMAPEVQARIFDPFFTTKATGRGLGLSALLGIMRGHRGGIELDSAPGSGTTFRMFFPLRPGAAPARAERTAEVSEALSGEVLLADDEPSVLEAGKALLEALGFTVHTAPDGEAAMAAFLAHLEGIRLVILDQTMPSMSGTDTFRAIRRLQPRIPVILASGFSEEEVGDELQAEGLDGFLQKPYRMADLERVVRKALAR